MCSVQVYKYSIVTFQIWPNFPFESWTIVHGVKKLNQLKKFMQVEVDVKCMHTKFGGHGLSSFGDITTFQIWTNFHSPWVPKNRIE